MKLLAMMGSVVAGSPLVSFSGVWELTSETVGLLKDATLYVHDKALEFVPVETRTKYEEYVSLGAAEFVKAKTQVYEAVSPTVDIVTEAAAGIYQVADKRTSGFVNTILADFERRFPRESGKIGRSLLDRVVLLIYLYVFFKAVSCSLKLVFGRSRSGVQTNKAALPAEPVIKEFKPPASRISEVASAPPRPSFPSKPSLNKP